MSMIISEELPEFGNLSTSKTNVKKPAWIGSISRRGLVEIRFYEDVFVPKFTLL
jgi:hypothetical protein